MIVSDCLAVLALVVALGPVLGLDLDLDLDVWEADSGVVVLSI